MAPHDTAPVAAPLAADPRRRLPFASIYRHGFVRAGLDDKVPSDLREIANPKLMGTTDQSRQDEGLREAKRLYD